MSESTSLSAVSPRALAAFRDACPAIIQETVTRALAREELVDGYRQALGASKGGAQIKQMLTAGLGFSLKTLDTVMSLGEPSIIDDQLAWASQRLPHDGVRAEQIIDLHQILAEVLRDLLPDDHAEEIFPFVIYMLARQRELMQEGGKK